MYDVVIEQVVAALDPSPAEETGAVPTVSATDATVVYGKRGSALTVTVTAPGVVPTGEVELVSGDDVLSTGELGADGSARMTIPPTRLEPRREPYAVTVVYSGDDRVAPGSAAAEVAVQRTPVVLLTTVSPRRPTVRESRVRVVVEVVNAYGVPRSGTVTASAAGSGSRSDTLQGGRVTLRLPVFTSTGRRTVVVRYGGSRFLAPARQRNPVRVVR